MIKKYGKNYTLIKAKIPTKTLKQVRRYGWQLHKKIEANPKHRHSALKKKLKPKSKSAPWTEKELKLMLKGLQKYVGCINYAQLTAAMVKPKTAWAIRGKLSQIRKQECFSFPVKKKLKLLSEDILRKDNANVSTEIKTLYIFSIILNLIKTSNR